jgi:DNA-binding transcriptional MerR regulator
MQGERWTVGEVAKRTGLSVRSLHHYDAIGLLSPAQRSDAGYRLYAADDLARLQQIRSLRQLGFTLEEIRRLLDRPDLSPLEVIGLHLGRVVEQMVAQQRLYERLSILAGRIATTEEVSAREFMETIEVMMMVENVEKYYTPEQLAELHQRQERIGPERLRQVETEWPALIAQVRVEMEQGTDPHAERMQALGRRWSSLIAEFTGGNPGIERSLQTMYANEPSVRERTGIDEQLQTYIAAMLSAETK